MVMRNRLNILLIDDDEEEYILLKKLIERSSDQVGQTSFQLDWVESYAEALSAYEKDQYDAYLVDYHLGECTGLDLMQEAAIRGCRGPVILLTGQGNYQVDLAAMEAGASDYLVKDDLNLPLLERSIRYAIEQKQAQDRLEELVQERTAELLQANKDLKEEIGRRKRVEAVLQESETKFRTLADTTSAAILIIQNYQICYANPAVKYVTGYYPEELVGRSIWRIVHPKYRHIWKHHGLVKELGEGFPTRYELKILTKENDERWVDVTAGGMEYEGLPAWVITAFDITERDLAERELRQAKDHLELRVSERTEELKNKIRELDALHKAASSLMNTLDLEVLLSEIVETAKSAAPAAEKGMLHLKYPKKQHKGNGMGKGFSNYPDNRPDFLSIGKSYKNVHLLDHFEGSLAKVVCERKSLIIPDLHLDKDFQLYQKSHELKGVRSLIASPLQLGEECIGSLSLSSSSINAFHEGDLRFLDSLAATASTAIYNASLYAEVQRLSMTDSLTELYNRRGLFIVGSREIERSRRFNRPLAAILLDIDHFKPINDTYGHVVGDQVLIELAKALQGMLRRIDVLARYGGEEFAILLPESDMRSARELSERIRKTIEGSSFPTSVGDIKITVSLGIAETGNCVLDLNGLLDCADQALYQAKNLGRNRIEIGY
jgi:diguanylate cyclase (GGDEF)-like protein/PAS domain S-box-containing protein